MSASPAPAPARSCNTPRRPPSEPMHRHVSTNSRSLLGEAELSGLTTAEEPSQHGYACTTPHPACCSSPASPRLRHVSAFRAPWASEPSTDKPSPKVMFRRQDSLPRHTPPSIRAPQAALLPREEWNNPSPPSWANSIRHVEWPI